MSEPTKAVAAIQTKRDIRDFIQSDAVKQQMAMALPKHLTADRMCRVALTAILRTPKLLDCSRESLLQALMTCSQAGLEPDGRNAHLIPYGNVVQVIFDYRGLVELAMRSGMVANIHADVVCENDVFEYDRGELKSHKIDFRKPRGEMFAAYSLVKFKDGTEKCEVMSKEAIEGIRKRSRAGNSGPWVTDFAEMAKKTTFRRLSKWITLSPEFRDAVDKDDDTVVSVEPPQPVKPMFPELPKTVEAQPTDAPPADVEPTVSDAPTAPGPHVVAPANGLNVVKALQGLCKLSKVTEQQVIEYLAAIGTIEESLTSFADIQVVAPKTLRLVNDSWQDIVGKIKGAEKGELL